MFHEFLKKIDTKNKIGKRVISSLITEENRVKLGQYLKDGFRRRMIRQVSDSRTSHIEDLLQVCLQHISPVTAPLAVVSQFSCSGGPLLTRLLDGHSRLYAYPGAYDADAPGNDPWPSIDIEGQPIEWFNIISQALPVSGPRESSRKVEKDKARFPFIFLPILQKQIFKKYLESVQPLNTRHVFDAHMTACFGAWLDYQNHGLEKKFITAYAPGVGTHHQVGNSFFEIYPDGRLIALIRDPADWFASASSYEPPIYGNVESAISHWKKHVREAIKARETFGDRVCIIQFESLTNLTEPVMRHLAEFLGIPYEDILLEPTFNGIPFRSSENSKTLPPEKHQDVTESITLDEDQRVLIGEMTSAEYQSATRHAVAF
jgi:hypothetical protein